MKQPRVIQLDPQPADMTRLAETGEMLVTIFVDEFTDAVKTEIQMGGFDFHLRVRGAMQPATKKAAVNLVKEFINQIDFIGNTRWRLGKDGPITDRPQL